MRRPETQICDLEGHDVPLNVRYIIDGDMLRLSVYVWKITVFIYFLANENHSTYKQWRSLDIENGKTAVIFVTVRGRPTYSCVSLEADFCWWNCKLCSVNLSLIFYNSDSGSSFFISGSGSLDC